MCEVAEALEKEGIEEGIVAMIEGCNELGGSKKDAYNKAKDKFALSADETDMYFNRHWK